MIRRPTGCAFHPRCRFARVPGLCNTEVPELRLVAGDAHRSACHYAETLEGVTIETLRAEIDDTDLLGLDTDDQPGLEADDQNPATYARLASERGGRVTIVSRPEGQPAELP